MLDHVSWEFKPQPYCPCCKEKCIGWHTHKLRVDDSHGYDQNKAPSLEHSSQPFPEACEPKPEEKLAVDNELDDSGIALSNAEEAVSTNVEDDEAEKTESQRNAAATAHLLQLAASVEDSQHQELEKVDTINPSNLTIEHPEILPDQAGLDGEDIETLQQYPGALAGVEENNLPEQVEETNEEGIVALEHHLAALPTADEEDLPGQALEPQEENIVAPQLRKSLPSATVDPKLIQKIGNEEAQDGSSQLPGVNEVLSSAPKRPIEATNSDYDTDTIKVASQYATLKSKKRKLQTYSKQRQTAHSTPKSKPSSSASAAVKVFYASSSAINGNLKTIKALGTSKTSKVPECDFFCTGEGSIVKSANLLHALALGKPIVTDTWLHDSQSVKCLKDHTPYLARDVKKEREWRCNIQETSEAFRNGLKLFEGKEIVITAALKAELGSSYKDFVTIATAAGAAKVDSRLARQKEDTEHTIWLAKEGDSALKTLEGQQCFSKDLLSMSVLRASLDLESDEFRLEARGSVEPQRKRRKKA